MPHHDDLTMSDLPALLRLTAGPRVRVAGAVAPRVESVFVDGPL